MMNKLAGLITSKESIAAFWLSEEIRRIINCAGIVTAQDETIYMAMTMMAQLFCKYPEDMYNLTQNGTMKIGQDDNIIDRMHAELMRQLGE